MQSADTVTKSMHETCMYRYNSLHWTPTSGNLYVSRSSGTETNYLVFYDPFEYLGVIRYLNKGTPCYNIRQHFPVSKQISVRREVSTVSPLSIQTKAFFSTSLKRDAE